MQTRGVRLIPQELCLQEGRASPGMSRQTECHWEDVLEKLGIGEVTPDQVRMTQELVRD